MKWLRIVLPCFLAGAAFGALRYARASGSCSEGGQLLLRLTDVMINGQPVEPALRDGFVFNGFSGGSAGINARVYDPDTKSPRTVELDMVSP